MSLEQERKLLEYKRVEMAMLEMRFKIKERQADIERLEQGIEGQKQRMAELEKELGEAIRR